MAKNLRWQQSDLDAMNNRIEKARTNILLEEVKQKKKLDDKPLTKIPKKRQHKEENIQIAVCNYLRTAYPHVIFMSDIGSGMKLSIGQAVRAKKMRSSRGQLDLFIAHPRVINGVSFHGLFLELKRDDVKIYLKDGITIKKDEHLHEQDVMIQNLSDLGYAAHFAVGFNEAKKFIDLYMNLK